MNAMTRLAALAPGRPRSLSKAAGLLILLLAAMPTSGQTVKLFIVQFNDIYEMSGVTCTGGDDNVAPACTYGGIPRMAALVKQVRTQAAQQKAQVLTIFAGDLLSPSGFQQFYNGANMTELMGTDVGGGPLLQYAVFGNHEFDVSQAKLATALKAGSATQWFTGNLITPDDQPISTITGVQQKDCPKGTHCIIVLPTGVTGKDGSEFKLKVGLIGTTVNPNKWAKYAEAVDTLQKQANDFRDQVDILVGVTHLVHGADNPEKDRVGDWLVANSPSGSKIDLILGGHDHDRYFWSTNIPQDVPGAKGAANTGSFEKPCHGAGPNDAPSWPSSRPSRPPSSQPVSRITCERDDSIFGANPATTHSKRIPPAVFKADANAISAWVHELTYNAESKQLTISSSLKELSGSVVAPDETMKKLVDGKWKAAVAALGSFKPGAKVTDLSSPLDGRESCLRFGQARCDDGGRLGNLILDAMQCQYKQAQVVMYNGGAIRIDEHLGAGATMTNKIAITNYDILRLMPFGGKVVMAKIPGDKLYNAVKASASQCVTASLGCTLWFKGATYDGSSGTLKIGTTTLTGKETTPVQVAVNDFLLGGGEQIIGPGLYDKDAGTYQGADWRTLVSDHLRDGCALKAEPLLSATAEETGGGKP